MKYFYTMMHSRKNIKLCKMLKFQL